MKKYKIQNTKYKNYLHKRERREKKKREKRKKEKRDKKHNSEIKRENKMKAKLKCFECCIC